jgi:multidrug efflux pump subunit AcrB
MGYDISMMSLFGLLALIGVVVNDSLVLVDYVNRQRDSGIDVEEAALKGGGARFRPILLTSLTTFVGLVPLMFETSTQAQFLIPMGISLAFGILFATTITLFLIPINYLLLEDVKRLFRWLLEKEPVDPKRVA